MSTIRWTQQAIFKTINEYTNAYMHTIKTDDERGHEFEGELWRRLVGGGLGGGKTGREKCCN